MENKSAVIISIVFVFLLGLIAGNKFWFGQATNDIDGGAISYRLTSVVVIIFLIFIAIYLANKLRKK